VTISSSVHTSILRSDAEAQILPKTASGSTHMGGLPVKEIVCGVTGTVCMSQRFMFSYLSVDSSDNIFTSVLLIHIFCSC